MSLPRVSMPFSSSVCSRAITVSIASPWAGGAVVKRVIYWIRTKRFRRCNPMLNIAHPDFVVGTKSGRAREYLLRDHHLSLPGGLEPGIQTGEPGRFQPIPARQRRG